MAKETNYFQHDYNARNHIKLRRLRKGHGAAGYGLYWQLVEMMHEDDRNGIDIDQDVLEFLAEDNQMELEAVGNFLTDCVAKYRLFTVENGFYTSDRVMENKDYREQIRQARSESGRKGGLKRVENLKQIKQTEAIASSKQANASIGKEIKGKESKVDIIKKKQNIFYNSLIPFVEKYGKEMVRAFYDHWHQPNKSRTQIRWELEKAWDLEARLRTWDNNSKNFKKVAGVKKPELSEKDQKDIFG